MSTNELRAGPAAGSSTSNGSGAASAPVPSAVGSGVRRHVPDLLVVILDCNLLGWTSVARARTSAGATGESAAEALEHTLADVLVFLNAHVAMQSDNAVAVYGSVGSEARLLYSTAGGLAAGFADEESEPEVGGQNQRERARPDANTFQDFKTLDSQVFFGVRRLIRHAVKTQGPEASHGHGGFTSTGLVPALSKALCLINRLGATDPAASTGGKVGAAANPGSAGNGSAAGVLGGFRPKMLILSVTGDTSAQYVAMMNCVFAAQKTGVPISVLKLHGPDSVFLQQASFLTGGIYLRVDLARPAQGLSCLPFPSGDEGEEIKRRRLDDSKPAGTGGLVQVLFSAFLPLPGGSANSSGSLNGLSTTGVTGPGSAGAGATLLRTPGSDAVDFRAACFCHHQTVSVGYVCSVCLSIFCHPKKQCDTCRSLFPAATVERLAQQRQLLVNAGLAKDISVD